MVGVFCPEGFADAQDTLTALTQITVAFRKNVEFYEDKALDVRFRSRLADFRDSGFDRGHMVMPHPPYHTS